MKDLRIIVVGGGIGGLTFAIAARQAGFDAQVYEQRSELKQVGAGLTLWHNAVKALQPFGLAEALQSQASVGQVCDFLTSKGSLIARWPSAEIERECGAPALQISREALHRVLIEQLDDEALHLGMRVTSFHEQGSEVVVTFEDGTTRTADILIGADGLRSVIRGLLHGEEPARFCGYTAWRAVVPGASALVEPGSFASLWGRGERFVYYELGQDELYWMSVANNDKPDGRPPGSLKEAVAKRHAGWMSPVEDIIAATPEGDLHLTDIYDRPPLSARWGRGRTTLLGDAAHPMTFNVGQGAGMGIEDSAMLVKLLKASDDPVAALRSYEDARVERTKKFQKLASALGSFGRWTNPVACEVRTTLMKATFRTVALRDHRKDMEYSI